MKTAISSTINSAVYSAVEICQINPEWLIDFLFDRLKDTFAKDSRFPKLTCAQFDLLVANLRREAERAVDDWAEDVIGEFAQIVIDGIADTL